MPREIYGVDIPDELWDEAIEIRDHFSLEPQERTRSVLQEWVDKRLHGSKWGPVELNDVPVHIPNIPTPTEPDDDGLE